MNMDNSMLISDSQNERALRVSPNASAGVVVASLGTRADSRRALFDSALLNLFVVDGNNCVMRRYYNGSLTNTTVFGSSCGTTFTQFGGSASFCMDSLGNFYVADNLNHRIMLWPANATNGSLLAGVTSVSGSDLLHLHNPEDITFDETHGLLYVADTNNHRIIRYSLNSTVGTVVAGGNGPGVARNKLNGPCGLYLSKKNNTLYIADTSNHRIVRWGLGDSEGATIAGDCNGMAGTSALGLNTPTTITMDNEEKYMYVSDKDNNRIQMFTLA